MILYKTYHKPGLTKRGLTVMFTIGVGWAYRNSATCGYRSHAGIIWEVKPTVIIETGIARGGSLVFNASQLALLDLCSNGSVSVTQSKRRCIGIDIDIRSHNRSEIESHALAPMITLVKGSSVDGDVVRHVATMIKPEDRVLVILDSNHTCQHVKQELNYYSKLVSSGSYLIVHDTGIEFAPEEFFENRDWGKGNNPLTAVKEFLNENETFKIDRHITDKLLITSSPEGYKKD